MTESASAAPSARKTAPAANAKKPAVQKSARKKRAKKKVSTTRSVVSWLVSGIVGVAFFILMALIVEARHTSFYGEPLFEKVASLASVHLHGLPEKPEALARALSGMPNLNLLPAEAVLHKDIAQRFTRLNIQFGYVQEDVKPGNGRYTCKATNTDLIPVVAWNIAAALYPIPDDVLQSMNLKYIIFCGDLFQEGKKVGGFPVPVNDLMLLNLTHRTQHRDIQEFFLHEFYHLVEARLNLVNDPEWGRRFGSGYAGLYQGNDGAANSQLGTGNYGFINRYSESFPYEDRAEIFARVMVSRPELIQFIMQQRDEMLYEKTKYVAETVRQRLGVKIDKF